MTSSWFLLILTLHGQVLYGMHSGDMSYKECMAEKHRMLVHFNTASRLPPNASIYCVNDLG